LLKSLTTWRSEISAENPPAFCLIDSGDYTDAVYEFVRQAGGVPFAASKGYAQHRFSMGTPSPTRRLFDNSWAGLLEHERLWLYHVNTEHWKQQVHERFAVPMYSESNELNAGSLSLYNSSDPKRHLAFSHHIVAEERRDTFVEGKGMVRKWVQTNKNNHYLDATALALAASGVYGHKIIQGEKMIQAPQKRPAAQNQSSQFKSPRFRTREGGWIPGR
jgi:hypothetical protein